MIASQSTDRHRPLPHLQRFEPRTLSKGQTVTVTGTATDTGGGVIGGVRSLDRWRRRPGTQRAVRSARRRKNWTYTFKAPAPGTYTIESRAVDDSLNLETPGTGCLIYGDAILGLACLVPARTPAIANDPNAIEVGVKFTSATSGLITGHPVLQGSDEYRDPYRRSLDLRRHPAGHRHLHQRDRERMAAGQLFEPGEHHAGTTYVASYHTNSRELCGHSLLFRNVPGPDRWIPECSGRIASMGCLPTARAARSPTSLSPPSDNYWVDVVFNDSGQLAAGARQRGGVGLLRGRRRRATTLSSGTTVSDPEKHQPWSRERCRSPAAC